MGKVLHVAARWSELPGLLAKYQMLIGKDHYRIFGYGSLIWNHNNIKTGKSLEIANEQASITGACVDMNIFAAGPNEFRGSETSTGLYASITYTGNKKDVANGLNLTIDRNEAEKAIGLFVSRELGQPPLELDCKNLFSPETRENFEKLKGMAQDDFRLYCLQIIKTKTSAGEKHSLVVSANEKSVFYAGSLPVKQAAHCILDGHGYEREVDGAILGGSSLEYFMNQLKGYRQMNIHHRRMEEIAKEVYQLAQYYKDVLEGFIKHQSGTGQQKPLLKGDLCGIYTPVFHFNDSVCPKRDAHNKTGKEIPRTVVEKLTWLSQKMDSGVFKELHA